MKKKQLLEKFVLQCEKQVGFALSLSQAEETLFVFLNSSNKKDFKKHFIDEPIEIFNLKSNQIEEIKKGQLDSLHSICTNLLYNSNIRSISTSVFNGLDSSTKFSQGQITIEGDEETFDNFRTRNSTRINILIILILIYVFVIIKGVFIYYISELNPSKTFINNYNCKDLKCTKENYKRELKRENIDYIELKKLKEYWTYYNEKGKPVKFEVSGEWSPNESYLEKLQERINNKEEVEEDESDSSLSSFNNLNENEIKDLFRIYDFLDNEKEVVFNQQVKIEESSTNIEEE